MVRLVVAIFLVLALSASVGAQTVQYVSDELTIAVRRGKSMQHRILRFVSSGTPVEVLEVSEGDGYTRIRTKEGTEGWVRSSDLSDRPGAAARLGVAQEKISRLETETTAQREELAALESSLEMREREVADLEGQVQSLSAELEEARALAADPLRLAEENSRLTSELEQERQQVAVLEQDNARLSSRSLKEWFVLGAAVSLGSLFLGIVITRVRWRRDSWDFR